MNRRFALQVLMLHALALTPLHAETEKQSNIEPLLRTIDIDVGQSCQVPLADGSMAIVKLLDLCETCDNLLQAVRDARVTVEINGQQATLAAADYHLPITVNNVQVDCPVTKGYVQPGSNPWALKKDVRLRLWPAGSPWIQPGTFVYPVVQRWFASNTQMCNEPVFVDGGENLATKPIYYHYGLDIGGAEGLVDVVAATDAVVITAGLNTISPPDFHPTVKPRYDVVYLCDGRGWYYRYSHFFSIDPAVIPGKHIKLGQKIGILGKEGASGGWSHLHLDISAPQPDGEYGMLDGYAFLWQAYHAQYRTMLQAVARPHCLVWTGQQATLDASRSWSSKGTKGIVAYRWYFGDGATAEGPTVQRTYSKPGQYAETLEVTDDDGRTDYDFAIVQVMDQKHPDQRPPTIHAAYWPAFGLGEEDEVTFMVRSFNVGPNEGHELWDFGDGSPTVEVQSDGNAAPNAKDGYAVTKHRFANPGDYLVSVTRTNALGQTATARLHVHID